MAQPVVAAYQYDNDLGLPNTVTDPNGNCYSYGYDQIGRLTSETLTNGDSNVGVTKNITYNDATSQISLNYGNQSSQMEHGQISYDQLFGKPTLIQRQLDGKWVTIKQMTYDPDGRLATEATNLGYTTSHLYDTLNRETLTTFPDGTTTTYNWDDRTETITDANGNSKVQQYDLLDRLTALTESPGGNTNDITSYTYDTAST